MYDLLAPIIIILNHPCDGTRHYLIALTLLSWKYGYAFQYNISNIFFFLMNDDHIKCCGISWLRPLSWLFECLFWVVASCAFSYSWFQAGGFLVSAQSHVVSQERELDENVYSKDDYTEAASLLEQVLHPYSIWHGQIYLLLWFHSLIYTPVTGNATWAFKQSWLAIY